MYSSLVICAQTCTSFDTAVAADNDIACAHELPLKLHAVLNVLILTVAAKTVWGSVWRPSAAVQVWQGFFPVSMPCFSLSIPPPC